MSHDPAGLKGTKIINFENFFEDFRSAADKYFEDLESSLDLQGKFNKRFPLGFADVP
jgi:hypothetical protein